MKILFFGDIVGKTGRKVLSEHINDLKEEFKPDFILANGENATQGSGLGLNAYNFLMDIGIDCITLGDHAFDRIEIKEILEDSESMVIRPANYPDSNNVPGNGWKVVEKNGEQLVLINIQGRVFMKEGMDSPFKVVDQILNENNFNGKPIIVDFHSEATSEIKAMGWYLNQRVTAVIGTHTHVQTNDLQVLPGGSTLYLSDVGMVGANESVLGVKKEIILQKFLTAMPHRHEVSDEGPMINGVYFEVDNSAIKDYKLINIK